MRVGRKKIIKQGLQARQATRVPFFLLSSPGWSYCRECCMHTLYICLTVGHNLRKGEYAEWIMG